MKYKDIIEKMTLEEKAALCVGDNYWSSKGYEKYGIPKITMSDGPHGLRVQKEKADNLGINKSEVSICFPSLSSVGNSWNRKIAYKLGMCLAQEAKSEDVNIILGPAINIKRTPLCGRNFEYISEDPYLTGILGSEYVKGMQAQGVGACVKHYAVNNQENRRRTIDVIIDERTLREIYLKAFELIINNAKPWSIMAAYNRVNGKYCTENKHLLDDILRKEWKYNGIVISDWGGENDRVSGIEVGQELEMPGGRGNGVQEIINAVKCGKIQEECLDEIVDRIIDVAKKTNKYIENNCDANNNHYTYDKQLHHNIAQEIAEDSIVLLKNENNILPIKNKKVAIIGDFAKNPRYQGAGSSTINPYKLENAYDYIKEICKTLNMNNDNERIKNKELINENNEQYNIQYAKGYERDVENDSKELLEESIKIAKESEVVLIFAGLTENYESEGIDRNTLELPANQNELINEICKVNKNVVIVLSHGSVITMPWKNKVKGIITGYLGGEAGAKAMANCLFGIVNPSGKLAESYPERLEDTPCYHYYPGTELTVEYKETIYVGYRYYDKVKTNIAFPFGFGLSYTKFEYSKLDITKNDSLVHLCFSIKNVGNTKGKEIAQIYVKQDNSIIYKPEKELKAFEKIELEPNEEKKVEITLDKSAFEYYNVETNKWSVEGGIYKILVGKSCEEIELEQEIKIDSNDSKITKTVSPKYYKGDIKNISDEEYEAILGKKVPNRHLELKDITDENTIEQIKDTKVGNFLYENQMEKMNKLFKEQNVNKATKVMMDLQKPLKKFYEKKSSNYTKEMVDELLRIAKENDDNFENIEFVKEYISK